MVGVVRWHRPNIHCLYCIPTTVLRVSPVHYGAVKCGPWSRRRPPGPWFGVHDFQPTWTLILFDFSFDDIIHSLKIVVVCYSML